jgi:hypothetical protein
MPNKYAPTGDEMDSSYAADNPDALKPPGEGKDKPSVDEENATAQTALISNKILSPEGEPIKEGDEIVVQVVKNYGDESEVKYAPHKEGESETAPETSNVADDFAMMDTEKA